MIHHYDRYEKIPVPEPGGDRIYCCFEGEDAKIAEMIVQYPQALSLIHLIMEGYLACEPDERTYYWREATEAVIEWMMKKGLVETVS
ncbi:MAG: hypothetical protein RDV48_03890 [Candidatus Eremiobacteraeota bacterium]|nr:hypothetical protein [Candidatus Eremiobacteraeota bacterium]